MNVQRGSLWRKWDLHIHTPASFKHWKGTKRYSDMTSSERDEVNQKIIDAMHHSDVAVFGIMDYWTFDGYFEIKEFLERNPNIQCNATILPGIELRVDAPSKLRLNIHALLSDKLSKQQINDFKNELRLLESNRPLSYEALREFAKGLDAGKARHYGYKNPDELDDEKLTQLGFDTAEVTRDSLQKAIDILPENSCLIMLPYDTHGGAEELYWQEHPPADNFFMRMANLFETRSQSNIDLCLGIRTPQNAKHIDDFLKTIGGKPKPVVSGSDAHSIKDYGKFPQGKTTWIKADPTFQGLRQTLISPSQRTFVGLTPPNIIRVASNKTKYLSKLTIERNSTPADNDDIWFDNLGIEFNHGLVAIIGNKGMGKSALADILGLLGNSERGEHFSFLSREKFVGKDRSKSKARNFSACLYWESGLTETKSLEGQVLTESSELVRYVPQNFFEKICNETELKEGGEFSQELEKIIFSHVEDFKKQGCLTLRELINQQTEEINRTIDALKAELSKINRDIADAEIKLTAEHRQNIEREIRRKDEELKAVSNNPPVEVKKPNKEQDTSGQIEQIQTKKLQAESEIATIKVKQEKCENQLRALARLEESISGFERQYENWLKNAIDEFELLAIKPEQLLAVSIHYSDILINRKQLLKTEENQLRQSRENKQQEMVTLDQQEKQVQSSLHKAAQEYERYKTELHEWEANRKRIETERQELVDKVEYLETTLPVTHNKLQSDREEIVINIFSQKKKLAEVYESLYKPVRDVIEVHSLIKSKYKLNFEVAIDVTNTFFSNFFEAVNQGVTGTYYRKEPGKRKLEEKLEGRQFDLYDDLSSFLQAIIFSLENNEHSSTPTKVELKSQLKKPVSEFYDFLFGLDYLKPRYSLKLDGKELPKLSPGERGILLLIFYLLIDKDDCPLIIDQPEENLDNQSVYELLVPCVEEAKMQRQIFIVTHNPNLAVVCDADQVVHAQIDKMNGNRVEYTSGSIENPEINKKVVDILEGTWSAFSKRESMYQIS